MKTRFAALSYLLIYGLAASVGAAEHAAAPIETPSQKQMTAQERARLHQRDMRHCLDKKSNSEIHRCAVKQRKR